MPLINKPEFIELLNSNFLRTLNENKENFYVGMGNPNADILLIGSEKAINPLDLNYGPILKHELELNIDHWIDLLDNYNHLENPFDLNLLNRNPPPLNGFNPFNPLFLEQTAKIVGNRSGHTYAGMMRLINSVYNQIFGLYTNDFTSNAFSKIFISELSTKTALNQNAAKFNLTNFLASDRYNFLTTTASNFYRNFKTIVIYCGRNNKYVGKLGTENRLKVIQIFNPTLSHMDLINIETTSSPIQIYNNGLGSKVILCRHLAAGFGNNMAQVLAKHI
jgi:hypothetical protein